MDYWEHRQWWQQHENILKAFGSLERSARDDANQISKELKESNAHLETIASEVSDISGQLQAFMSYYAQDRALSAQLEADRFEFNLRWDSLTVEEKKDFLRARDELLAEEAEQERQAQLEWEAGEPERERNRQLIIDDVRSKSAIANQRNKEYFENREREKQAGLRLMVKERTFDNILRAAQISIWLGFILSFSAWVGLSIAWSTSMALLLVPFLLALLVTRFAIGSRWRIKFDNAVYQDKNAAAFRSLHGIPTPTFELKFPYLNQIFPPKG